MQLMDFSRITTNLYQFLKCKYYLLSTKQFQTASVYKDGLKDYFGQFSTKLAC